MFDGVSLNGSCNLKFVLKSVWNLDWILLPTTMSSTCLATISTIARVGTRCNVSCNSTRNGIARYVVRKLSSNITFNAWVSVSLFLENLFFPLGPFTNYDDNWSAWCGGMVNLLVSFLASNYVHWMNGRSSERHGALKVARISWKNFL